MASHETCREVDLPLPVQGVEQSDAERLGIGGQIVGPIIGTIARDSGRWHVQITREVERHRAVQNAAYGLEVTSWSAVSTVSQSECSLALPKRATLSAAA
jgi:hypothetical protein